MTRSLAAPAANQHAAILEIRNRMAMAGWVFMLVWLAMLLAFTWLMARDGPSPSQPPLLQHGALALFWLVGIGAGGHIFSLPCTRLSVAADGSARLRRWTLFGREDEPFPPGAIAAVEVRSDKDSDGDPYFRTVLVATDGRERVVREGHDPDDQRALAARLRQALGLA
jgi:hypothetical protein